MLNFSLALILAHLLGDFVLQPQNWITHLRQNGIKSQFLYLHITIHFILMTVLTNSFSKYWIGIAAITIFHYLVEVGKLKLEKKTTSKVWFFIAQALHIIIIAGVIKLYYDYQILFSKLYETQTLLLLICILSLTFVSAAILKIILDKWDFRTLDQKIDTNNAGTYIGILERIFIFTFVLIDFWTGIGFLLAAKSVFRFGDLKESKDVKLTEYILIGTLLSFGLAIAIALFYIKTSSII